MKPGYVVITVFLLVLVAVGTFFYQATTIYSAQVVAKETDAPIGIAPFEDRVDFGDIPCGNTIAKEISLENIGDSSNRVYVYVMGDISKMVIVEPGSCLLEPGARQIIKLRLTMPASATPETQFDGRVLIIRLPTTLW